MDRFAQGTVFRQPRGRDTRVAGNAGSGKAAVLDLAGGVDPLLDLRGWFAGPGRRQFVERYGGDFNMQIEPVEQGTRYPG